MAILGLKDATVTRFLSQPWTFFKRVDIQFFGSFPWLHFWVSGSSRSWYINRQPTPRVRVKPLGPKGRLCTAQRKSKVKNKGNWEWKPNFRGLWSQHRILKATKLFHKERLVFWGRTHHSNPLAIECSFLDIICHSVAIRYCVNAAVSSLSFSRNENELCGTKWKVWNSLVSISLLYLSI